MSFKINTLPCKKSTMEVKVQLATPCIKSKMEALTLKLSVRYMVMALYIQVNINDKEKSEIGNISIKIPDSEQWLLTMN